MTFPEQRRQETEAGPGIHSQATDHRSPITDHRRPTPRRVGCRCRPRDLQRPSTTTRGTSERDAGSSPTTEPTPSYYYLRILLEVSSFSKKCTCAPLFDESTTDTLVVGEPSSPSSFSLQSQSLSRYRRRRRRPSPTQARLINSTSRTSSARSATASPTSSTPTTHPGNRERMR
jgi:hypothetical protein